MAYVIDNWYGIATNIEVCTAERKTGLFSVANQAVFKCNVPFVVCL